MATRRSFRNTVVLTQAHAQISEQSVPAARERRPSQLQLQLGGNKLLFSHHARGPPSDQFLQLLEEPERFGCRRRCGWGRRRSRDGGRPDGSRRHRGRGGRRAEEKATFRRRAVAMANAQSRASLRGGSRSVQFRHVREACGSVCFGGLMCLFRKENETSTPLMSAAAKEYSQRGGGDVIKLN